MKVLLVSPLALPIPDVKGGAIERLMTMLIEQNEIFRECDLNIISIEDEGAKKIAEEYQHCKFFWVKRVSAIIAVLYNYFRAAIYKLFRIRITMKRLEFLQINRIIKRIKTDVIVMEGGGGEGLYKISRKYGKDKFYLHLHHHYDPNEILDDTFGHIISTSNFINNNWVEKTSNKELKSVVVPNCIDSKRFSKKMTLDERIKLRQALGYKETDFIAVFCGRIIVEKGVKELIKAFEAIDEKDIKLIVIGSPDFALQTETSYMSEVRDMMSKVDSINYIGYVDNAELSKYYQMSDVMIVPSLCEEASGLVVLEGITAGLPVIATRSGGLPENVNSECAVLLEQDEHLIDGIKENVLRLYKDSELRRNMSEAALKKSEEFTIERYYHEFMEAIKRNE